MKLIFTNVRIISVPLLRSAWRQQRIINKASRIGEGLLFSPSKDCLRFFLPLLRGEFFARKFWRNLSIRERERERSERVMRRNPGSSFYFENCWATLGKLRGRISERLARMKLPVSAATNFSRGNVHNNRRAHKRVGKRASEKRNGVCCTVGVALTFVPSPFLCARVQPAPFHRRGSHLIPPRLR